MKKLIFTFLTLLLVIILIAILSETGLRMAGFKPWYYTNLDNKEPTVYEPHPILGWINKKGTYTFLSYAQPGKHFHINFLKDGQRRTKSEETAIEGKSGLLAVGGSFTQGWAIADEETYSWKLQEKRPDLNVINYGTGAYGTYQSLLTMEKVLPQYHDPKIVLYGFIEDHELRNIAAANWMELLSKFSKRGHVRIPYVTLDNSGKLKRHKPAGYPELPLRSSSVLITFLEKAFMDIRTSSRTLQKRKVTEDLLLEMKRLCKKHGATFTVAILSSGEEAKKHYLSFLQENDIKAIDCVYPFSPDLIVPKEGHPNGKMNTLWTEKISQAIDEILEK